MSELILSSLRDLLFKELINKVRRCGRTSELIGHENRIEDPLLLQVWRFLLQVWRENCTSLSDFNVLGKAAYHKKGRLRLSCARVMIADVEV